MNSPVMGASAQVTPPQSLQNCAPSGFVRPHFRQITIDRPPKESQWDRFDLRRECLIEAACLS